MNLIADFQSAEQVMPTIRPFDDPTSSLEARILSTLLFFLAARFDMRDIAATPGRPAQFRVVVAFVAAKMLAGLLVGRRTPDHDRVQRGAEPLHVMRVSAREGDRQRDAVGVREQMSLGAQFASIRRVLSGLIPPLTGAETITPSSDWKRQPMPRRSS